MCPVYAYRFPVFQPAMRIITSITNSAPASITTSFPHNYLTGLVVRLDIPPGYGMQQANQLFGSIAVTGPTTFNINFSTLEFDSFATPSTYPKNAQQAQVVPIGEDNNILTQAVMNALPYSG